MIAYTRGMDAELVRMYGDEVSWLAAPEPANGAALESESPEFRDALAVCILALPGVNNNREAGQGTG